MGERINRDFLLDFDRRVKAEFHGADISTDGGLLLYRELDDILGLTVMGEEYLLEKRRGRNTMLSLLRQFRQSVFSRLAGFEDTNNADRLRIDPAMRFITKKKALDAASWWTVRTQFGILNVVA